MWPAFWKYDFWGKECCWALNHSKSRTGMDRSFFSHYSLPSAMSLPAAPASRFVRDAGAGLGCFHLWGRSCHWTVPWASQELGQEHPWTSQRRQMLCWTWHFLIFSLFNTQREISQTTLVFSPFSLFPHSLRASQGGPWRVSHLCQRWDDAVPKRSTQASTKYLEKNMRKGHIVAVLPQYVLLTFSSLCLKKFFSQKPCLSSWEPLNFSINYKPFLNFCNLLASIAPCSSKFHCVSTYCGKNSLLWFVSNMHPGVPFGESRLVQAAGITDGNGFHQMVGTLFR